MEIIPLLVIALSPPAAFLWLIRRMDKIEPEPIGLITKVLLAGCAAVVPAAIAEILLLEISIFKISGLLGAALKSFAVIAPVEEALKLAAVMILAWNNSNFNEENDGIVYTGAASIGFAMVENVLYVAQEGVAVGIMRGITSIPLHAFTAVFMGYAIGAAKFAPAGKSRRGLILRGYLIAFFIHAVYDTIVLSGTEAAYLVIPTVIALFVFGFRYLKKGKALSERRWAGAPATAQADVPSPSVAGMDQARPSGSGVYKIVISRIIFSGCACLWALMGIGLWQDSSKAAEAIAGGVLFTFLPVVLGMILEISYRAQKRAAARTQ